MKQIFDWLREQMQSKANLYRECPSEACWIRTSRDCEKCDLKSLEVREIFDLINEAEAKWESDCCEWKPTKRNDVIASPHMTLYQICRESLKGIPYCPFCGKRIKISEVSNGMG